MDATVQKISAKVDSLRDELVAFLSKLVQFPTLPGQEQAAQQFYAEQLRGLGLETQILPSRKEELDWHPAFCDDGFEFKDRLNVVARWTGSGKKNNKKNPPRSLILNGHMDVVPPGNEALWTHAPWSGEIKDGKVFGRGSCDMKAGLTANLYAVRVLQSLGFHPTADVLLESVIGEESGGVGTLTTIVKGFKADAAIITEPTRLHVCPVQSGALTFRIRISGRAAHACMKLHGVNAIEKFFLVMTSVQETERRRHLEYKNSLYEEPTNIAPINFGTIRAGEWHSTVPDELVVEGRFGVLPGESAEAARRAMTVALARASDVDHWLKEHPPKLEWFEGQFESGQTPLSDPIVESVNAWHAVVFNKSAVTQAVTYGSDLRLFTNHAHVPAVLYGPGNVLHAHTVDEYVDLGEVFASTKSLAYIIMQWCGGEFS
jgi:acetylornithine deacetylase